MIFALMDGEPVDARKFESDAIAVATCWRCGEQVELNHNGEARAWVHSDREDAALCTGDKDVTIAFLCEKVCELKDRIETLESERNRLWRMVYNEWEEI